MGRELLVREIKAAALARMEDAARTEDDFKKVITQWNHNDKNRERKERYWEIGRPNEEMLHWDRVNPNDERGRLKPGLDTVIPRPIEHEWWRQQLRGDFIDTIFDCPHELHELVGDAPISILLRELLDNHKEILYYSAIRQYSNARIAARRKQTDRNIRKTLALLLKTLRDRLAAQTRYNIEHGLHITHVQRSCLLAYDERNAAAIDSGGNE